MTPEVQAALDARSKAEESKPTCPNCKASVWNVNAHFVPGNFITPAGWACATEKFR